MHYSDHSGYVQALRVGTVVNDEPYISGAPAISTTGWVWTYRLASGELAPGLTLDQTTGIVSGVATTAGSYDARIQATLDTPLGSYSPASALYGANVSVPTVAYLNTGGTGLSSRDAFQAFISQPFEARPSSSSGQVVAAVSIDPQLPDGLALDPVTGAISGIPRTPATTQYHTVRLKVASTEAIENETLGYVAVVVTYPFSVRYSASASAMTGVPASFAPEIEQASPLPLVMPTMRYAPGTGAGISDCSLPAGMGLDPATGVISGTPTTRGMFNCFIDVTATNNGFTWGAVASIYIVVN